MDLAKIDLRPYCDYKISDILRLKGKWGFRVTLIYEDETTKTCQHSGFLKKSDATEYKNIVIGQLHSGIYVAYSDVKVKELLPFWLEYYMKPQPKFTANSYTAYKNSIEKHIIPKIGNIKLLELNAGHIQKLYKEVSKKYISIPNQVKTVLKTAFKYAISKRLMINNPCDNVSLPQKKKKAEYHTIKIDEKQTYTLEQIKVLIKESEGTRIHMQILFAVLMGLRKGEINGLKYSDIDFKRHKLKIRRQLGKDIHKDITEIAPKTVTKQEIKLKTEASEREISIPDYVFDKIVEERKKYEKNRSRRQHGTWVFQDLDYICCSSYGRPRSKDYHYQHYKDLIEKAGLPYIRFHDLRHTYTTLLLKNDINQKAVASVLGHAKSIITVDTYGDTQAIIEDGVEAMQEFIDEVHPYDYKDVVMLKEMFDMERKIKIAV